MNKLFTTEYRLFAAVNAYCQLLQPMVSIRAYSGATRLYLMTGLGVSLSAIGDLTKLADTLEQDKIILTPPSEFIRNAIALNCIFYVKLLSRVIFTRLNTRGSQDIPSKNKTAMRLSYNISANLAQQLAILIKHRSNWGLATSFQNLADMAMIEYSHMVQINGIGLPNDRSDDVIIAFLAMLENVFADSLETDPRILHLPILTTVLCIARLLFADFSRTKLTAMGPLRDRIWLSDSTLAALPLPSVDLARGFVEKDAGMLSTQGWLYLQTISAVFPDRFVNIT